MVCGWTPPWARPICLSWKLRWEGGLLEIPGPVGLGDADAEVASLGCMVVSSAESSCWCRGCVPQGWALGPVLLKCFFGCQREGQSTPAVICWWCITAGSSCCYAAGTRQDQRNPARLEKWAGGNLMEVYEGKCSSCPWGGITLVGQKHTLGLRSWKAAWQKKPWVCWWIPSWTQATNGAKNANSLPSRIPGRSREVILPLSSAMVRPHLEWRVQLWVPRTRDTDILEQVQKDHEGG